MSRIVKKIDKRESVRVVTDNKFITAHNLPNLSLKARKLLYLTLGQARKRDTEFYTYEISPLEFAEIMGIAPTHVYQEAFDITAELASLKISVVSENKKKFKHIPVTSLCEYDDDSMLRIEVNRHMAELLLGLNGNFSQPQLSDFMRMRSVYSMAIWHLMQREMKSQKPGMTETINFDLSLEELREVTGTQEKLKQVGQFKDRVLNKALREIEDNCAVIITYQNIKRGRSVIGFHFSAESEFHIDPERISKKTRDRVEKFKDNQRTKRQITTPENKWDFPGQESLF